MLIILLLFVCLSAAGPAAAVEDRPAPEFADLSIFDLLLRDHLPGLTLPDAPTVINGSGLNLVYWTAPLPYDERPRPMRLRNRLVARSPLDLNIAFVELGDVHAQLSNSGLDLRDLVPDGTRDRQEVLAELINPRMDHTKKEQVLGFDPRLCLNDDGSRVFALDVEDSVLSSLRAAEDLYHRGDHSEYRTRLLEILEQHPRLSAVHVGLANSFFVEGQVGQARQWLAQGLRANRLNPMLFYSQAFCHLEAGRRTEAVDALIDAVITCRTNMLAWCALDVLLGMDGRRVNDRRFRNQVTVDPNSSRVMIDPGVAPNLQKPWLYYAAASIAMDHERGRRFADFSALDPVERETYRLVHLLGSYLVMREDDPEIYDTTLENLDVIRRHGFLREYVIFDRIAPYIQYARTATLSPGEKEHLRDYVLRFDIRNGAGRPPVK